MNNLFTFNILDVAVLLMYVIGSLIFCRRFLIYKDYQIRVIPYLMIFLHVLATIGFYLFVLNSIGDAKGYYLSVSGLRTFENTIPTGSVFIVTILYPFVTVADFSFFSAMLMFSFFSLQGFFMLYDLILKLLKGKWTPWLWLFLMPSMHFWTAAVGKDALIFLGVSWLLFNYLNQKKLIYYLIPLIIIGLTRFYVLALVGVGLGVALVLLSNQLKISYKVFAMLIFGTVGFLILPYFLTAISVGDVSNIAKQSKIIITANQEGGGAVDLQNSNLAVKWFSYLFRPFIFEARSAQMILTSIENILWLVIFWKIVKGIINIKFVPEKRRTIFWISVACILTVTLPSAYILSNFGISSRQKIMIVPFMMYLFYESLLAIDQKKLSRTK